MAAVIRMYVLAGMVLLSVKVLVITNRAGELTDASCPRKFGTRVGKLLDEAVRYKAEWEEEHGRVPEMAAAVSRMAVRTIRWLLMSGIPGRGVRLAAGESPGAAVAALSASLAEFGRPCFKGRSYAVSA